MVAPQPQETARTVGPPTGGVSTGRKSRSRPELVTEAIFNPLARIVTKALVPLKVPPPAVVVANAVAGLAAALAIFRGELVAAALLLQLKTVLDNADGQLARARGRTSALGRYLDTEADLVVNAVVFAALAHETGAPLLSAAAFCALTLVLSANFNADVLYRRTRGESVVTQPPAEEEGRLARALASFYAAVFAPQDRLFQGVSRSRLQRVLTRVSDPEVRDRVTLTYHDGGTVALLSNFGLSSQLFVLGVCLAFNVPLAYLWLTLVCLAALPVLELRREVLARRALPGASEAQPS